MGDEKKWLPFPRSAFNMLTVTDENGMPVAHVTESSDEKENWFLLAAAPELLRMVKLLRNELNAFGPRPEIDMADELIARAEGRGGPWG